MAQVSLDQVRKVYDNGHVAVAGATFDVDDGELLVLVGPSGCGKSTLLRMIAGLEDISSGTLRIGDRVVNDVAPKDRDIAMVFQNYALYPHMTVAGNLGFGLKLRGASGAEIARLHRQLGATMVYVTHDQVEAMTLGQRIVVLKDGHVQQIDTPMALYARPANLFVATFLGSPAMNVLRGRLVRGEGVALDLGDGLRLPLEGGEVPAGWFDREVALGVRPEHLVPATGASGLAPSVEMVEALGNETLVNLRLGPHALVARMAPHAAPEAGAAMPLALAPGQWHAFDAASGERLAG